MATAKTRMTTTTVRAFDRKDVTHTPDARRDARRDARGVQRRTLAQPEIATLLSERRTLRLAGGRWAIERLASVARLVACAYQLDVDLTPDGETAMTPEQQERRELHIRLAGSGQYPLLIGDPSRRAIWLSRTALDLALERARYGANTLEIVDIASPHAVPPRESTAPLTTPLSPLYHYSSDYASGAEYGPGARLLLLQSDALLALAPLVAERSPRIAHHRYVVAMPINLTAALTAMTSTLNVVMDRLLCIPLDAATVAPRARVAAI